MGLVLLVGKLLLWLAELRWVSQVETLEVVVGWSYGEVNLLHYGEVN